mgnify:FL=1
MRQYDTPLYPFYFFYVGNHSGSPTPQKSALVIRRVPFGVGPVWETQAYMGNVSKIKVLTSVFTCAHRANRQHYNESFNT